MAAAPVARPHRPFASWAPRRWWVQPTMTVQRGGRKSGQRRARPEGAVWHPRCPRARRLRPQCDRPLAMCRHESLCAAQSCQCHCPRAGWCHCRWRHRRLLVVATTWPRRWRPLASGPDLDWPCAASLGQAWERSAPPRRSLFQRRTRWPCACSKGAVEARRRPNQRQWQTCHRRARCARVAA